MPIWRWVTPSDDGWTSVVVPTHTTTATSTIFQPLFGLGGTTTTSNSIYYSSLAQQQAIQQYLANDQQTTAPLYLQQAQTQAYERYQMGLFTQPWPLSSFQMEAQRWLLGDSIAAPALITHQEEARRDEAAYRRALAECNEQEAARLLRLIETRELAEAERRAAIEAQQQQQRERVEAQLLATERARQLLLEHLTPEQRTTFVANGWFLVEGGRSKTKYRIEGHSVAGNIQVLDKRDRVAHRLCCHVRHESGVPHSDHLLAQKIMLELAEDDFLRLANRH